MPDAGRRMLRPVSGRRIAWILGALALAAGLAALALYEPEPSQPSARPSVDRDDRDERTRARLRRESERLVPPLLEGIHVGMSLEDARRARPAMVPDLQSPNPEARSTLVFEERLANGARAVYIFARRDRRLERLQVLSLLPSTSAITPHLAAMNEQYGAPTGVWDCPDTGGVPTRRFTWRHGELTVSDVFLVHEGRVSVTLYIAPSAVIERSLRMGACQPVRDPSEIDRFPVAPSAP